MLHFEFPSLEFNTFSRLQAARVLKARRAAPYKPLNRSSTRLQP